MIRTDDHEYYRLRLEQEHARAAAASHASVRLVHLELAANYAARLNETLDLEPRLRAVA